MFKTLAFASVIAAVAAASETAHAVDSANGISANGLSANGLTANGLTSNGLTASGLTSNGAAISGRVFVIELPSETSRLPR
jgi:hypothetical protein